MPQVLGVPEYPLSKTANPKKGDMLVTKGEYIGITTGTMGDNFNFMELDTGKHKILSGGALAWRVENGHICEGDVIDIKYLGKETVEKGKWAGKPAHSFEFAKYSPEELPKTFKPRKAPAPAKEEAPSPTAAKSESLDDLE